MLVYVAVAGVHVQRDEDTTAQHFLVDRRSDAVSTGWNTVPSKILERRGFSSVFHEVRTE